MAKSDTQRRADLEDAKVRYRRRTRAVLNWDEIAMLYGITKPAMHNLAKTIEGWPDHVDKKGNAFFFPAYKVVVALLHYVKRKEEAEKGAAIAFQDLVRPAVTAEDGRLPPMTATEQLKAYELRQKIVDEEVANGVLHRADHCAAVSDAIFTDISRTFGSSLADTLDPNGQWPPEVRTAVTEAGENLTLRCYARLKDMLTAGVVGANTNADNGNSGPSRAARPRARAGQGRKDRKG